MQYFCALWFKMRDRPKTLTTELKEYATRWLKPNTQGEGEIVDKVVLEQVDYASVCRCCKLGRLT